MIGISRFSRFQSRTGWTSTKERPGKVFREAILSVLHKRKVRRDSVSALTFHSHEERPFGLLQQRRNFLQSWLYIFPSLLPTVLGFFELIQRHAKPLGPGLTEILGASRIENGAGDSRHDHRPQRKHQLWNKRFELRKNW
jgi:hypothetical protein